MGEAVRIIDSTNRKDYYDSAQGLGVDLTRVFNREFKKGSTAFPISGWNKPITWGSEPEGDHQLLHPTIYVMSRTNLML